MILLQVIQSTGVTQSTGVIQATAIQSMGHKPVTVCELSVTDSMMRSVHKLQARAKKLLQKFEIARTSMRMISDSVL